MTCDNDKFKFQIEERKRQQAPKQTVVTEFKATLASLNGRTLLLKEAGACMFETGAVTSTTILLEASKPFMLPAITKCLIISCDKPIVLNYFDANDSIVVMQTITNQFLLNGSIQYKISLLGASVNGTTVKLIYG